MQLEDPQVANPTIVDEIAKLRARIAKDAPYTFVKLSHHGSDNAFSETILDELGASRTFGICAGEHSTKHPNRDTLTLLDDHEPALTWARTDHNGLVSIDLGGTKPKFETTRGKLNDPRPNAVDPQLMPEPSTPTASPSPPSQPAAREVTVVTQASGDDIVEVITRIPHVTTRVTVSIDVEPGAASAPTARLRDAMKSVQLANGRPLPRLLFVTQPDALARNIGGRRSTARRRHAARVRPPVVRQPAGATRLGTGARGGARRIAKCQRHQGRRARRRVRRRPVRSGRLSPTSTAIAARRRRRSRRVRRVVGRLLRRHRR
jgi:hypothetical protein